MEQLIGTLSGIGSLSGGMSVPPVRVTNPYEGSYEYTPSDEVQTIEISGLRATENIVINAIPTNYGHIAWNGSTLTVS